jgi:hypothetical protein
VVRGTLGQLWPLMGHPHTRQIVECRQSKFRDRGCRKGAINCIRRLDACLNGQVFSALKTVVLYSVPQPPSWTENSAMPHCGGHWVGICRPRVAG